MSVIAIKRKHVIRPTIPGIDKTNRIGRKIDFYAPIGDSTSRDFRGRTFPANRVIDSVVGSKHGKVSHFETDDYIDYGDTHDLGSDSLFFGCRFKTTQTDSYNLISKASYANDRGRWYMNYDSGNFQAAFVHSVSKTSVAAQYVGNFNDGKWHFALAVVTRGVGIKLYVDGNLIASNTDTTLYTEDTAFVTLVGRYNDPTGLLPHATFAKFTGEMSDVVIGHNSLSDADVKRWDKDFYQILESRPQYLSLVEGAAPTGFKPAWAIQQSSMIGAR